MRGVALRALCASILYLGASLAFTPAPPVPPTEEVSPEVLAALADPDQPTYSIAYFEQYIDHGHPELGTFNQTFWYNSTFYKGPGSPIVIMTPGEVAATGYISYLSDQAITGMIAKEIGAAVLLVEHRFWGNSTPWEIQTTERLQYLNLDQAVADFVHIARTVELPFDVDGASNAPNAPWIWTGGSYSGALGAWIESLAPGTMWATHSSSGPVEAIYDYWQYFYPIQQGMPQNCSKDYAAIVDYVDDVFLHGTDEEVADLKKLFNLQDLVHLDDAGTAITSPIWAWQSIQFYSGYSAFYEMCDAIEGFLPNSTNSTVFSRAASSADGVGIKKALPNFASWFKSSYLPGYCAAYGYEEWQDENSVECFNTYNETAPMYTDWTEANAFWRTWVWMTCNDPFFYYQTGAPSDRPSVFSRLVGPEYYQRQCPLFFPQEGKFTYGSALGKTAADINAHTKGWKLPDYLDAESRLMFVNGEFDPWRSASVASEFRPGGPLASTAEVPAVTIPGSRHCNDLRITNRVNSGVAAVQDQIVAQMASWVAEFGVESKPRRSVPAIRGRRPT
ncbi:putative serine peptidase [Xylariomycetidae sp. FL2044]|nr:putative serine peptidase [Xylariomycetidae sp. FL2044]